MITLSSATRWTIQRDRHTVDSKDSKWRKCVRQSDLIIVSISSKHFMSSKWELPSYFYFKLHQTPKLEWFASCLTVNCLCPIHWSQLLCREWRCSWSSAGRRCSNYICMINTRKAYYCLYWRFDCISYFIIYWECEQYINYRSNL